MLDDNTFLLQEPEGFGPRPNSPAVPLFLIHDGGGTVFQYFSLGDLDRPVYAIGNPRFESGEPWSGGIPEMARAYADLVHAALPPGGGGQVILGGWSLGGLIALELAHLLSNPTSNSDSAPTTQPQPGIQVLGVVMIDSAHPSISRRNDVERDNDDDDDTPTFQPTTKPHIREKITRCFREARRMIREYEPPPQPPVQGELGGVKVKLLRAREGRRRRGMQTGLTTDDGMMGWGRSGVVGEEDVVEIAGSHFTVFEDGNVDSVTKALKESCDALAAARPS